MDTPLNPVESVFQDLSPAIVWRHFAVLCAIPRPSKKESRLIQHLVDWATSRSLSTEIDAAGNLVIRKPASVGCESAPGVVLQAHLDMVCQANAGTAHDFERDPIRPRVVDGWLRAEETTLGADNGIGVALALAALENDSLQHGPLEALFTVDEESGMGGARGLGPTSLKGRLLLNLDTEEWGRFYLGCAGGINVVARRVENPEALPKGFVALRIELGGLRGGHSGINIHEGRGNAIKGLVRVLRAIEREWPAMRLAALRGGTARNALPREAWAVIAVPGEAAAAVFSRIAEMQAGLCEELAGVDDGLALTCAPCAPGEIAQVLDREGHVAWLSALHAAPQGVRRMSVQTPGVVETSDNLGIVDLTPGRGESSFMVRSLIDAAGAELAEEIVSLFALAGIATEVGGHYPGWAPNPASPLLAVCQKVYRACFGDEATLEIIHAGLECGLIGGKYPDMDMVSFGPTIHGAHAPGEAVEIASVEHCWCLLREILSVLAEKPALDVR